jgi:hypothetical protein
VPLQFVKVENISLLSASAPLWLKKTVIRIKEKLCRLCVFEQIPISEDQRKLAVHLLGFGFILSSRVIPQDCFEVSDFVFCGRNQ